MRRTKKVLKYLIINLLFLSLTLPFLCFINNGAVKYDDTKINSQKHSKINSIASGYSISFVVPGSSSSINQSFNLSDLGIRVPKFSNNYANELFIRTLISEN